MSGKNPKFTMRTVKPPEGMRGIPVVCFPNGPPPPSVMKADEEGERDIDFTLFRHAEKRRASWRAVVGQTDAMRYEGITNPAGKQESRLFIGFADADSGDVSVSPADAVYGLTQNIRNSVKHQAPDTSDMSSRDRLQLLVNTFGSKKRQAEQRSRAANRVDADMVAGGATVHASLQASASAAVSQLREGAAGSGSLDRAAMESRQRVLPPFNLEAQSPAEAYPVDGVVTPAEMTEMGPMVKDILKMIKKKKELDKVCEGEGGFGPYFKLRMQALATRNAEDKKRVGRYLYYMQYLLRLYRQPSSLRAFRPDQLAESLEVPEGVAERFMELFADETQEGGRVKYIRSKVKRDKLLFYILVLALHIEGFEMDLAVLASELKLSPRELSEQVRHLGCSVSTKKEKNEDGTTETSFIAKLDMPLTFPRPRRKRARK